MKKISSFLFACLLMGGLTAQDMPAPSPAAMVMQRVGLTDVTVEYSRPAVNNRMIFGDLVPFNEMWRTGANKNTTITFSTDAKLNGQEVKAGTYSVFTIPSEDEWVVILNKDTGLWGTGGYTQRNDALRIRVPVGEGEFAERFTISIDNMTDNSADLTFAWSTTEVVVPVTVEVAKQTEANINQALGDAARAYRSAAEYYSKKGEHDKALGMIDQSIAMSNNWYSNWVKAEVLAAKGDKKAAKKQAMMALDMGEKAYAEREQPFTYKESLTKEMNAW